MGLFRSLGGMVEVRLTGADLPGSMKEILNTGIECHGIVSEDALTMRFFIPRRFVKILRKKCSKRGDRLEIIRKRGIYWSVRSFSSRPVLIAGMLLAFALTAYLPTRVLFIQVEGNEQISEKKILEAAASSGIGFGTARKQIRSEQIKNALLEEIPQLQWAGVTTAGCVATIHVREREIPTEPSYDDGGICSIVASADGVIVSATARRGNLLCQPGQAVAAGDVLISAYNDVGLAILASRAEGEVFAQTRRLQKAVTPLSWDIRLKEQERTTDVSLILGKKRINLWKDSGISHTTCGRMYEEYYITLPGGFKLPAAIAVERVTTYFVGKADADAKASESFLKKAAESSLCRKMVAGKILSARLHSTAADGVYRLEGEYVCIEMIGKVQREQIGEEHVENS